MRENSIVKHINANKKIQYMGQKVSVPKLYQKIEDLIWTDTFEITETSVYMQLDGLLIYSATVEEVIKQIGQKEKEHFHKALFFAEKNCEKMSTFHNNMMVRHSNMKHCLILLFCGR